MKRIILATTAVVALATPTFAQSSAEATVTANMVSLGYDASVTEALSDAQIVELFTAFTSEDQTQINAVIEGLDLAVDEATPLLTDTPRDDDTRAIVREALLENNMAPGVEKLLTDGEYTELFIAASSGDATLVNQVIAGFDFNMDDDGNMMLDGTAGDRVLTALEMRGVTEPQLEMVSEAEMAEIYLALTGDDETAIGNAIASAIES